MYGITKLNTKTELYHNVNKTKENLNYKRGRWARPIYKSARSMIFITILALICMFASPVTAHCPQGWQDEFTGSNHTIAKTLYRRFSRCAHPDKGGSEAEFLELSELYEKFREPKNRNPDRSEPPERKSPEELIIIFVAWWFTQFVLWTMNNWMYFYFMRVWVRTYFKQNPIPRYMRSQVNVMNDARYRLIRFLGTCNTWYVFETTFNHTAYFGTFGRWYFIPSLAVPCLFLCYGHLNGSHGEWTEGDDLAAINNALHQMQNAAQFENVDNGRGRNRNRNARHQQRVNGGRHNIAAPALPEEVVARRLRAEAEVRELQAAAVAAANPPPPPEPEEDVKRIVFDRSWVETTIFYKPELITSAPLWKTYIRLLLVLALFGVVAQHIPLTVLYNLGRFGLICFVAWFISLFWGGIVEMDPEHQLDLVSIVPQTAIEDQITKRVTFVNQSGYTHKAVRRINRYVQTYLESEHPVHSSNEFSTSHFVSSLVKEFGHEHGNWLTLREMVDQAQYHKNNCDWFKMTSDMQPTVPKRIPMS